jgi:proline racemase
MRSLRTLTVVRAHAEGEVGNVVVGGVVDVPGATMFDKKLYLEEHRDDLRRLLLFDPRGAVNHSVNFVLPPCDPAADMGYVVAESTEYPAMSGSNTMCTVTVLLEMGILPMTEPVTRVVLESPAGLIPVECTCQDGKVTSVRLVNQPAFVHHLDAVVEVEGHGSVTVDVAWGGMTYVLADAAGFGFALTPDEARDLCVVGQQLKTAAAEQLSAVHPLEPRYAGITQTEWTSPVTRIDGRLTARNAVVVSPGRLDRSPCGTGTSARLAVMHAKGQVAVGEELDHVSVIGTHFIGRIESTTMVGPVPAVVPSIAGQAWLASIDQVLLDPTDPFPAGYTLSDTWMSTA